MQRAVDRSRLAPCFRRPRRIAGRVRPDTENARRALGVGTPPRRRASWSRFAAASDCQRRSDFTRGAADPISSCAVLPLPATKSSPAWPDGPTRENTGARWKWGRRFANARRGRGSAVRSVRMRGPASMIPKRHTHPRRPRRNQCSPRAGRGAVGSPPRAEDRARFS
jgi:hypothetical protein